MPQQRPRSVHAQTKCTCMATMSIRAARGRPKRRAQNACRSFSAFLAYAYANATSSGYKARWHKETRGRSFPVGGERTTESRKKAHAICGGAAVCAPCVHLLSQNGCKCAGSRVVHPVRCVQTTQAARMPKIPMF